MSHEGCYTDKTNSCVNGGGTICYPVPDKNDSYDSIYGLLSRPLGAIPMHEDPKNFKVFIKQND